MREYPRVRMTRRNFFCGTVTTLLRFTGLVVTVVAAWLSVGISADSPSPSPTPSSDELMAQLSTTIFRGSTVLDLSLLLTDELLRSAKLREYVVSKRSEMAPRRLVKLLTQDTATLTTAATRSAVYRAIQTTSHVYFTSTGNNGDVFCGTDDTFPEAGDDSARNRPPCTAPLNRFAFAQQRQGQPLVPFPGSPTYGTYDSNGDAYAPPPTYRTGNPYWIGSFYVVNGTQATTGWIEGTLEVVVVNRPPAIQNTYLTIVTRYERSLVSLPLPATRDDDPDTYDGDDAMREVQPVTVEGPWSTTCRGVQFESERAPGSALDDGSRFVVITQPLTNGPCTAELPVAVSDAEGATAKGLMVLTLVPLRDDGMAATPSTPAFAVNITGAVGLNPLALFDPVRPINALYPQVLGSASVCSMATPDLANNNSWPCVAVARAFTSVRIALNAQSTSIGGTPDAEETVGWEAAAVLRGAVDLTAVNTTSYLQPVAASWNGELGSYFDSVGETAFQLATLPSVCVAAWTVSAMGLPSRSWAPSNERFASSPLVWTTPRGAAAFDRLLSASRLTAFATADALRTPLEKPIVSCSEEQYFDVVGLHDADDAFRHPFRMRVDPQNPSPGIEACAWPKKLCWPTNAITAHSPWPWGISKLNVTRSDAATSIDNVPIMTPTLRIWVVTAVEASSFTTGDLAGCVAHNKLRRCVVIGDVLSSDDDLVWLRLRSEGGAAATGVSSGSMPQRLAALTMQLLAEVPLNAADQIVTAPTDPPLESGSGSEDSPPPPPPTLAATAALALCEVQVTWRYITFRSNSGDDATMSSPLRSLRTRRVPMDGNAAQGVPLSLFPTTGQWDASEEEGSGGTFASQGTWVPKNGKSPYAVVGSTLVPVGRNSNNIMNDGQRQPVMTNSVSSLSDVKKWVASTVAVTNAFDTLYIARGSPGVATVPTRLVAAYQSLWSQLGVAMLTDGSSVPLSTNASALAAAAVSQLLWLPTGTSLRSTTSLFATSVVSLVPTYSQATSVSAAAVAADTSIFGVYRFERSMDGDTRSSLYGHVVPFDAGSSDSALVTHTYAGGRSVNIHVNGPAGLLQGTVVAAARIPTIGALDRPAIVVRTDRGTNIKPSATGVVFVYTPPPFDQDTGTDVIDRFAFTAFDPEIGMWSSIVTVEVVIRTMKIKQLRPSQLRNVPRALIVSIGGIVGIVAIATLWRRRMIHAGFRRLVAAHRGEVGSEDDEELENVPHGGVTDRPGREERPAEAPEDAEPKSRSPQQPRKGNNSEDKAE